MSAYSQYSPEVQKQMARNAQFADALYNDGTNDGFAHFVQSVNESQSMISTVQFGRFWALHVDPPIALTFAFPNDRHECSKTFSS